MSTRFDMWIVTILIVLIGAGLFGVTYAADDGPYIVRVPYKGRAVLKALVDQNIDILSLGRDGYFDVAADAQELEFLRTLGVPISVIRTPDMVSMAAQLDDSLGLYHTYGEMESTLTALETAYPGLAKLDVMGTSIEGRNIYVLRISDNVLISEDEPEVLIMGNHHAREIMSVEIPLKFAEYLLENYGVDPTVTDMIDNREIYIAPMINPDGHVYVQQNHGGDWSDWWRKNRRDNGDGTFGVDLNRNYSYKWGYDNLGSSPNPSSIVYRGTGPFSEPETQTVRDFCQDHRISLAFSYHSYGEWLLYPWGYIPEYTPDHDLFLALGDSLTSTNGYLAGNAAMGVIYEVNGDTDDWAYGETTEKDPFLCFTPEVNSSEQGGFGPPDSLIQPTFDLLLPMNILLLQLADNPHRVLPPYHPTMYAIDDTSYPMYTVGWSGNDPSDPNPVTGYDVIEYKNIGSIAQDPANAPSSLWIYDGFDVSSARAYEDGGSYYSGAEDQASHTLRTATFYQVTANTDTITSWVWYDIETDWDYTYLDVSTDGGITWETVPGNLTTTSDPWGNNRGNGITGSSPGWVEAIFPLTQYLGEELELQFNYVTDQRLLGEGIYIDLPGPVPTYEERTLAAADYPDTLLDIAPQSTGDFTYRVRARDAEDHMSLWSSSETITIDDLTAVDGTPRIASRLGANYPNPFNPVTHIPYTIGTAGGANRSVHVTLRIYDVSGKPVATVVDKTLPPGIYEALWKGTGASGNPLPSGIYFARLTVGSGQTFARKLVLLK